MANGSKSDYLENKLLDLVYSRLNFDGTTNTTIPATLYAALFTAMPTDAGGGTEVSGGAYARVAVTNNASNFPVASGGSKSTGAAITFPQATANWGKVLGFAFLDASSGGNMTHWSELIGPAKTFTADAGTDTLTSTAHGFTDGTPVKIFAALGAVLPTGIAANTTYYVRDAAANTFKVAATLGGAAVDITVNGGGKVHADYSKDVNIGDTPSFASSQLTIKED